ncbi:HAMP domain-containing histidine kinase [Phorcysia thermohydrogeniphila]|uniref:histidine kinase n=1 Tax=Phorcysia thermohydrogeniphila TaxID=936138 RepID=A0A4R1GHU3_9BACT|nr:HAMP domain-containing histidine kinase [Phorcysia thermohydrogeniphila]TCK06653.1 hypothetical protein CLV27_0459 [Phorcysia thermohydrogeniphila]
MKFETKVILSVILSLTLGLSILNAVSVTLLKREIEKRVIREAELYSLLCQDNCTLPDYIVVSKGAIISDELKPVLKKKEKIFWINTRHIKNKLKEAALTIFLWEVTLLLFLSIVTAKFINRYLRQEKEIRDYLKIILLVFTHKLGNFLSLQRINLELIKSKCGPSKPLRRMEEGYELMEKNFFQLLSAVKELGSNEEVEPLNLKELIEELLKHFSHLLSEKKIYLSLKDVHFSMKRSDAENLFFFLLDNAFKYSSSKIWVRLGNLKGRPYFALCNDVSSAPLKGSGVGLELVKFICERYGIRYQVKRGRTFCIFLHF